MEHVPVFSAAISCGFWLCGEGYGYICGEVSGHEDVLSTDLDPGCHIALHLNVSIFGSLSFIFSSESMDFERF
jgi:hypothetical protein